MNIWEQIRLKNFQSWKELTLPLHPNVNMIVGSSDVGKSAILRAIYWLCFNRPLGNEFISKWGKKAFVEIRTRDMQIQRVKSKTKNYYKTIFMGNVTENTYEAMRSNVPQDIIEILNVHPINFQLQHDNSFLLSDSSAEVARYLNDIVDLNVIDISLANAKHTTRSCSNELENVKKQLENLTIQLENYNWLNDAEADLKALDIVNNQINDLENKSDSLIYIINGTEEKERNLAKYNWIDNAEKDIEKIDILNDEIETEEKDIDYLSNCIDWIKETEEKIENEQKIAQIDILYQKVVEIFNRNKQFNDKYELLKNTFNNIKKSENRIIKLTSILNSKQKEFDDIMPDICPLCGK